MTKIAILGGTGYTACELIKILLRHPDAEIVAVTSRDEKLPAVAESHPSLAGRINLRMEPFDADKLIAKGVECVFGCLPHGASMDTVAALIAKAGSRQQPAVGKVDNTPLPAARFSNY